ncbi:hypothetical protein F444_01516 [Phytophthora nicotianae P1976]|uniref:Uncharacterized protein n=1 Tax=Phytophthora nicotianae P1976 TaxID=1317066 RepID=A0A081B0B0_PHYNI|nr:hypothetical protein F444_01516 [Phytophthora nicotianae P1976]
MSAVYPGFDSQTRASDAMLGDPRPSTGHRKVRLSDRELFERIQRIPVPNEPLNLRDLSSQHGWKHVRTGITRTDVYMRVLHAHSTISPIQTQQCQVVTGGEMQVRVSELMALLRAPTESQSNALQRALYGPRFIYSSLLHTIANTDRGSLLSPQSRGSTMSTCTSSQQLTVRTVSFVRMGLSNPFKRHSRRSSVTPASRILTHAHDGSGTKNEQCCYIELLTPTEEGFKLAFCSLDPAEVTAGKAPPERVTSLHPISGWLIAQPTQDNSETLRFTFQVAFTGSLPGGCGFQVAQNRLLFLAKRVRRLEKVIHRQQRRHQQRATLPGRLWDVVLMPFQATGVSDDHAGVNDGGAVACVVIEYSAGAVVSASTNGTTLIGVECRERLVTPASHFISEHQPEISEYLRNFHYPSKLQ